MKKTLAALLAALMLAGCGSQTAPEATVPETTAPISDTAAALPAVAETPEIAYQSRFDTVATVTLSDEGIATESDAVTVTNDIIYYEDRETYDSGNPYGEGNPEERHTAEEAAAHTVVNITQPGAYRITGKLSAGQIRIDLGVDAYEDPDAVVELILDNADITCTVAPAILFQNTYECDGNWSTETAKADVDTSAAGANLILEGTSKVSGSHVAKIFKDKEGEKKLWKQDGAIYSYMSMNVYGPGSLELTADNEGLDTELHLTLNGGNISIYSGNDGINTNEDGVSVTTVNGGDLTIFAGLDKEGDGIDSNGYLVINGGTVVASAHPAADAGLDSDLGSYIHGGTVIAMGSTMDWAESDSEQVTMNLQFARQQQAGSKITVTREDGTEIFSFEDDGQHARNFSGLILSHPYFSQGETYHVYVDGVQMAYTGTDVGFGPGGMGRPGGMGFPGGEMPEDFDPSQFQGGQMPEGFEPPADFDPSQMGGRGPGSEGGENRTPPEGFDGQRPEGMEMPEGFDPSQFQNGEMPEDFDPSQFANGELSEGFDPNRVFGGQTGEAQTGFYMNDKVNAFSGVTAA